MAVKYKCDLKWNAGLEYDQELARRNSRAYAEYAAVPRDSAQKQSP